MPGVGKTTLAPLLAAYSQLPWLDLDTQLEQVLGVSIRSFLNTEGEAAFRKVETEVFFRLRPLYPRAIWSLGGGFPLSAHNRAALQIPGYLWIFLKASPSTLALRLAQGGLVSHRLLEQKGVSELASLLANRQAFYDQAPWKVCTDDRSPAELAQFIWQNLQDRLLFQSSFNDDGPGVEK